MIFFKIHAAVFILAFAAFLTEMSSLSRDNREIIPDGCIIFSDSTHVDDNAERHHKNNDDGPMHDINDDHGKHHSSDSTEIHHKSGDDGPGHDINDDKGKHHDDKGSHHHKQKGKDK